MKKMYLILMIGAAMVVQSCSLSKSVQEKRGTINGYWTLTDINFENAPGQYEATLFNDQRDICFEGSQWFFRSNNSTGWYEVKSSSICNADKKYIRWSVLDNTGGPDQLQFKFTDEKFKDISGGVGYRFHIETLTSQEMVLKSSAPVGDGSVVIVYTFHKNQVQQ